MMLEIYIHTLRGCCGSVFLAVFSNQGYEEQRDFLICVFHLPPASHPFDKSSYILVKLEDPKTGNFDNWCIQL